MPPRPADLGPLDRLTSREIEVLKWAKEGKSAWEISLILHVSERTVKYHMGEIIARLHLDNRAQVIEYAKRTGLVR